MGPKRTRELIEITSVAFSLQECTRKEADLLANSAVFQDKFSAACKDMGIAVGRMVVHVQYCIQPEVPIHGDL